MAEVYYIHTYTGTISHKEYPFQNLVHSRQKRKVSVEKEGIGVQ